MLSILMTYAVLAILSCTDVSDIAEVIVFPAGNGQVTFTHKKHQDVIRDCTACHTSAPGKMRESGQFRPHKLCIGCHETRKSGPVNCVDCHKPSEGAFTVPGLPGPRVRSHAAGKDKTHGAVS